MDKFLKQYFIDGCKRSDDLQVGVEWEKIGVCKDSGKAIGYSGPRGVETIFKKLMDRFGWQGVYSKQNIIALKKQAASITLEPGGQIELSGQKAFSLDENASELYAHLEELKKVSEPLGIAWLGIGVQPISKLEEIEWVPKERYKIMREALKKRGALTYRMMKQTASIQISLDYTDEKDAAEKFRLAMAFSPVLVGIFANSPVLEGKITPFLSARTHIWSQTAPERTGILQKAFDPDFKFDDYVEYALDVPLLFIMRDGKWIPGNGLSFRTYLKKGLRGHTAAPEDWNLHLTTIFTDARLKNYIEVRSGDCQKKDLGLSIPALLKGIFYCQKCRAKAWEMLAPYSYEQRLRLRDEASKKGLNTVFGKKKLGELAWEFVGLAEDGLRRLAEEKPLLKNDLKYLAPLKNLLKAGLTPAEVLIRCFRKASSQRERLEKILHCAAI